MKSNMQKHLWVLIILLSIALSCYTVEAEPRRILLDTDVDTEDLCALLYLLKLNQSNIALEAVTISANAWSDAGHAVNQIYDVLHMMDRDDVSVGVGGEGGVLDDGTILPNVGGYLPLIEQGMTTSGGCRYRQSIPVGQGGRLDIDSNFGLKRAFLPQGRRRYVPLRTLTSQEILIEKVSKGPITILMIGSHSNLAYFLMQNPHFKKNIEHIYIMGGGVRPGHRGNLFTSYASNPYAEFNIFVDPFAAYQVLHSGVPITLVPLDATDTIPVDKEFFEMFNKKQETYEAQYCFKSLKIARDTWPDNQFYSNYFLWDSFTSGVAASTMMNQHKKNGENEFAEMEYMNITVVTSNEPYGTNDGSNPFFNGRQSPKFGLKKGGIHSGHVQRSLTDPFCIVKNAKGTCQDGYTKEINGSDSVRVLVATRSKPSKEPDGQLRKAFFKSFLDVLNHPKQAGKFNFTTQFPYYREVLHKPDFGNRRLGKAVVFDMDMSPGDFLALLYLLKAPVEVIDLKAIIVSPTGWANAATIDVVYDLLHMMGRDDIHVGLGEVIAANQSDPMFPSSVGGCKYVKAIPHGSGGFLDSDSLYGLSRSLPRSPRRYTAENSVEFGAPRNTDHPELRQPRAMEVWELVVKSLEASGSKATLLTNGPLTNLAKIVAFNSSLIQDVYIVGGHLSNGSFDKGNLLNMHPNAYAEMNMFLDPFAAKAVFESSLNNIFVIPLEAQRIYSSDFFQVLQMLKRANKTPEVIFAHRLLSKLQRLQHIHRKYHHMDMFLGEILGAVFLAGDHSILKPTLQVESIKLLAEGDESTDGQTILVDEKQGKVVNVLKYIDPDSCYAAFANQLGEEKQSAIVGSFQEQKSMWSMPPESESL
ncbi:Nucleoside hydrolase 3 [Linum grandiflorum]